MKGGCYENHKENEQGVTLGGINPCSHLGQPRGAQTCAPPPSDLVSWWDGDAVSGSSAFDIQDGNDGTLLNGATVTPGKVGKVEAQITMRKQDMRTRMGDAFPIQIF